MYNQFPLNVLSLQIDLTTINTLEKNCPGGILRHLKSNSCVKEASINKSDIY